MGFYFILVSHLILQSVIDFHCHPDLYKNNFKILNNGNKIVFMTNLPVLFERYYPKYKDSTNTFLALGYHPELIEESLITLTILNEICIKLGL